MAFSFYICSCIALISTICVIFQKNAIYSLIYLIISLLSVSGIFFSLGSFFAGALEVIIYAGAIVVLFAFVIMTLNIPEKSNIIVKKPFNYAIWFSPILLLISLFSTMTYAIFFDKNTKINFFLINIKNVGISLFGPYILLVEIASLLLLSALIIVFHIGTNKIAKSKML